MARGVVHYGDNWTPLCRKIPFLYFAWSTDAEGEVTCKRCLAALERRRRDG